MRLIKGVLRLLLLLLVLLVAAVLLVPLFVDPNDYHEEIAALVKERTGRDLVIEEDMRLSLFPWLGLKLGRVSLGNAPGFGDRPFASIENLDLKLRVRPLLDKRIEIDTVVLDGLKLNLEKDARGLSNWADLNARFQSEGEQASSGSHARDVDGMAFSLDLQGVDIRNAEILWEDRQLGESYRLRNLSLVVGNLTSGSSVPLRAGIDISRSVPRLEMGLELAAEIRISGDGDPARRFSITGVNLTLDASGEGLPDTGLRLKMSMDMQVDPAAGDFSIDRLRLTGPAISLDGKLRGEQFDGGTRVSGDLSLHQTSLRELLVLAGLRVETRDPEALASVSGTLDFVLTPDSLVLQPIAIQLDTSHLTGNIRIASFEGPVVRADLELDNIDLDRYLPPESRDEPKPAVAKAGDSVAERNPFQALQSLDLQASLRIGRLKVANARLQDTRITIGASKGVLRIDPLSSRLYQGRIDASAKLDARRAPLRWQLRQKLRGIQVGPLLNDLADFGMLSGTGDVQADLRMVGSSEREIRGSLTGSLDFSFRDGAVRGINIARTIREAGGLLRDAGAPAEDPRTDFSELSASAVIKDGLLVNEDLYAKSPLLRVRGKGRVNLAADTLDYTLTTVLVGSLEGQGGSDLQGLDIPVRFNGDLSAPDVTVDTQALLSGQAGKKLEAEKDRFLKRKIKDEETRKRLDQVFKGLF